MKRNWWYALLGIAIWTIIYFSFSLTILDGSSFTFDLPQILFSQLFLFFVPGLIVALLFYEIANIKKEKERNQAFWAVFIILIIFFIAWRYFY
ncbi:MAG: hypothetical protein AABY00_00385 [Nanoarchaeota archaeon]